MKTIALILTVLLAGCNLAIAQSPYATRLPAELQTAQMDSLADVTWLQGTTPAIRVEPLLRGRPVAVDADTTVRMVIGPSATGTLYAVRTNLATVTNAYEIQWPTIGTNSAGEAWFYTLLFDRAGFTYWSGSGKLYIEETTSTASNGLAWIEYTIPNVGWANVVGDPADNAALVQYVEDHGGGSAEDTIARAAVAGVESNVTALAETVGGITAESLGALTEEAAEVLLAAATNALLDLAGTRAMTGDSVTLARDVKSRDAASVADSGAAFGYDTVASDFGAAFGYGTVAGYAGAAFGANTTVGDYGAAFGEGTMAGYAGAAFGSSTKAGDYGFSAGNYAYGTAGSFVFADSQVAAFDRTNAPNSFNVRVTGGAHFLVGTNWLTATNDAQTNLVVAVNGVPLVGGITATNAFAGLPSILVSADWTWTNAIYAVGADTSSTNISVTLPDAGTNFVSVIIRKFSNLNNLTIMRGTNTVYTLYDDGSVRSYDWWPQRTNWYWRN